MAESLNSRIDRLEDAMERAFASIDVLADKQARLDDVLVLLTEAQIKTQERFLETDRRIQAQFEESDRRFQTGIKETERLLRESGERLDARIDKLVSAIGEFIRVSAKN